VLFSSTRWLAAAAAQRSGEGDKSTQVKPARRARPQKKTEL